MKKLSTVEYNLSNWQIDMQHHIINYFLMIQICQKRLTLLRI